MVLLSNTSLISDILFGMCWFYVMGELPPGPVQVLSLEISPLLPGLHQIQLLHECTAPCPLLLQSPLTLMTQAPW